MFFLMLVRYMQIRCVGLDRNLALLCTLPVVRCICLNNVVWEAICSRPDILSVLSSHEVTPCFPNASEIHANAMCGSSQEPCLAATRTKRTHTHKDLCHGVFAKQFHDKRVFCKVNAPVTLACRVLRGPSDSAPGRERARLGRREGYGKGQASGPAGRGGGPARPPGTGDAPPEPKRGRYEQQPSRSHDGGNRRSSRK